MDTLKNKVAIVTGGGRGIGRGVAKLMATEGASVVVVDPGVTLDGSGADQAVADEVVREIVEAGGKAVASHESVVTMKASERIIKTAVDSFGGLDMVVTCHGILRDRMIFNMTEQEWDDVIAVHLKGNFTLVKQACVLFRQQRSGRIITFTSESGLIGNSGQANYGAAKSGVAGFTKVVARDMGRYGVTANAIAPRAFTRMVTAVPQVAKQLRAERGITGISGDEQLETTDPEDIAPFVVYLASDYAANVNGQTFLVHGGEIAVISQPRPVRSIFNSGGGTWSVEELAPLARDYLTNGLSNPAPPQTPRDEREAP